MPKNNFETSFLVDQSSREVFDAINNVRGWWSEEIEGGTQKLHDEFIYRHKDLHYSKQKLVEVIPSKRVVWQITDSSLSFVKDKTEWTGTRVIFDISSKGNKTQINFTQEGLVPELECFDACSGAWGFYINNSLRRLIVTGEGAPDKKENKSRAKTETSTNK